MIHILIVSHGHSEYLTDGRLEPICSLSSVNIYVRDNLGEIVLKDYCKTIGVHYSQSPVPLGFGANNNSLFKSISYSRDDHVMILNPDVKIASSAIASLSKTCQDLQDFLVSIELWDPSKGRVDQNTGNFPTIFSLLSSYVLNKRDFLKPKSMDSCIEVDWCSGSFMFMPVTVFDNLGGFDEDYFMYMEDVDFCRRYGQKYGRKVFLLREVCADHEAQRANRRFFSRAFFWHVYSIIVYFIKWRFVGIFVR